MKSETTENKPIDLVEKRITGLSINRAQFCLRALMLAAMCLVKRWDMLSPWLKP